MVRIKHLRLIFVSLLCTPLITGCWDKTSIDKRAYVVAIGLDKGDFEDQIKITYLITNPEFSKQEGASNEPANEIITFNANDIITSKNMANSVIAKDITYNLLTVLLISEELARDKDTIRWLYDALKEREIKRNIPLIVTKENTSEFLENNKPKLETRMHKYFEWILNYGNESGYLSDSQLERFFRITEADADLFLAIYGTTQSVTTPVHIADEDRFKAGELFIEGKTNATQFSGSAVFKEGKMIDTLTAEETRLAILLNNTLRMKDVFTTYPDPSNPKYRIVGNIVKNEKTKIKMNLDRTIPTIDVTIPLLVNVISEHNMENYGANKKKTEDLKKHIEDRIIEKINKLVQKTQEDFEGEPFGWSLAARKYFLTIPAYKKFDWENTYPNMKVNIKVNVKFGEFGRQSELPDLSEMRD